LNGALEFGYQFGRTILSPLALGLTLLMAVVLLMTPRRYVTVPFLVVSFYITELQRIVVGGLDFPMTRILIFFGILRVVLRERNPRLSLNSLDSLLILYALSSCVIHTLLLGTVGAFIGQLGYAYDILVVYFFLKVYLSDVGDILTLVRYLCWVSAGIALSMLIEYVLGRNLFAVFGGVPAETIVRDGKMRCQGAFLHPILAGTFGATIFPLFAGMYQQEGTRKRTAVVGMLSSVIITVTSSSSGPLIALAAGIFALAMWPMRRHVKALAASLAFVLLMYSVARSAPFYRLIVKFSAFGSSSNWHRYELIDNFVRRLSEWWLVGTSSTSHWGWMMQDLANQYVFIGVNGGLVTLALFLASIATGFLRVGRLLKTQLLPRGEQRFAWAVGCALFAHMVAFLDVSYGGPLLFSWNMLLCVVSVLTASLARRSGKLVLLRA
jgi:hypothetical protein